jgi:hypothetical protein
MFTIVMMINQFILLSANVELFGNFFLGSLYLYMEDNYVYNLIQFKVMFQLCF